MKETRMEGIGLHNVIHKITSSIFEVQIYVKMGKGNVNWWKTPILHLNKACESFMGSMEKFNSGLM